MTSLPPPGPPPDLPTGPPPSGPPPSGPPPSGPPPAGPPGAGAGAPSSSASRRRAIVAAVAVALVVGIVAAVVVANGGSDDNADAAVTLEPISAIGANPFMPSVGQDQPGITAPGASTSSSTSRASATSPTTTPTSLTAYPADTPGLYGGTRNVSSCDMRKLVSFLERTPDKAAAWAQTLGIDTSTISSYVDALTPVILRADTRVTNHGYRDGHATELQSVLQAGMAVLVDRFGQPVVKCSCGNPLTAPKLSAHPQYTGTPWPTFSPKTVIVVQKTTVVINEYTIVDTTTGKPFTRAAGTDGSSDDDSGSSSSTTTTAPPTTTTVPGTLVDGSYTLTVKPGNYPGCGQVNGSPATLTVQGDQATIRDPDSNVTYSGTVDRQGGKFHIAASVTGATFSVDGTIDSAGAITGTVALSGGGSTCTVPLTGTRN